MALSHVAVTHYFLCGLPAVCYVMTPGLSQRALGGLLIRINSLINLMILTRF